MLNQQELINTNIEILHNKNDVSGKRKNVLEKYNINERFLDTYYFALVNI